MPLITFRNTDDQEAYVDIEVVCSQCGRKYGDCFAVGCIDADGDEEWDQ